MPEPNPKVLLEAFADLTNPVKFKRLQLIVGNIGISPREFPTEVQDMLMRLDMDGIEIWTQPEHVPVPLIDDVWKSERYVRDMLSSNHCKYPDRDRWLALFVKVRYPHLYRHLVR